MAHRSVQQDSARCHISRVAMNVLDKNHIRTLPWSALSPDLNPIEHVWDEFGRRVHRRVKPLNLLIIFKGRWLHNNGEKRILSLLVQSSLKITYYIY
jgi:transposase